MVQSGRCALCVLALCSVLADWPSARSVRALSRFSAWRIFFTFLHFPQIMKSGHDANGSKHPRRSAPPSRRRLISPFGALSLPLVVAADSAGRFRCKYYALRRVGHLLPPLLFLDRHLRHPHYVHHR